MPRVAKKTHEATPRTARLPRVSVLERRLQNPFGDGSPKVELRDPGWVVHIINTLARPGRYHDVVRNKGWVPVEPADLEGQAEDYGFDVRENRVVRGERGTEVLMKMPAEDYAKIQMAKDAHNKAKTSPARLKRDVVEQTAAQHGDEAGDYLYRNVTITDTRAPVPLEEPVDS